MEHHKYVCNHSNCNATSANESVRQTLSEMDWERGIWNAGMCLFTDNPNDTSIYNKKTLF